MIESKAALSSDVVQVDRLTKSYGAFRALDACSLHVPRGSIFGLLGPNGAGKTTLIRCLMGFLRPTSGRALVEGLDCRLQSVEIRRVVSYLPAEAKLFRLMRGEDCLNFFASIHPRGDRSMARELARRLDLDLQRRVAFMSTGMRQKLALCCVMSCPSPLMILDEPTANLDPTVRNIVLELVREAASRGASVIFCSHVLSEIEEICDDVAILRMGQVVYQGRVAEIRQIHRLRARANGGLHKDSIPQGARLIESLEGRIVMDLPGTLDHYLDWMARMELADVQVEMVGLRSLYESHHVQVPARPSPVP